MPRSLADLSLDFWQRFAPIMSKKRPIFLGVLNGTIRFAFEKNYNDPSLFLFDFLEAF